MCKYLSTLPWQSNSLCLKLRAAFVSTRGHLQPCRCHTHTHSYTHMHADRVMSFCVDIKWKISTWPSASWAGKPFRAWPILHAGQHFYVNWQFRQIEQSTVREGGMKREMGGGGRGRHPGVTCSAQLNWAALFWGTSCRATWITSVSAQQPDWLCLN